MITWFVLQAPMTTKQANNAWILMRTSPPAGISHQSLLSCFFPSAFPLVTNFFYLQTTAFQHSPREQAFPKERGTPGSPLAIAPTVERGHEDAPLKPPSPALLSGRSTGHNTKAACHLWPWLMVMQETNGISLARQKKLLTPHQQDWERII